MNPEFSIIIPVRDRSHLLQRCLDSVAAQTYRPLHVVVVDNYSVDDSAKVAERWALDHHAPDFRITLRREDRIGVSYARNLGLRSVTSDVVMAFDSDDEMHENLVQTAMDAFQGPGNPDIVTWRTMYHPLRGPVRQMKKAARPLMRNQIIHAVLRTQGYAVKTSLLRQAGAWSDSLPCWNDWELGIRLICRRPVVTSLPDVLAEIHATTISITGTGFAQRAGAWERAIDTALEAIEASDVKESKRWLRLVNYRRAVLAAHYLAEERPDLAAPLMEKALSFPGTGPFRSAMLRFACKYISTGGRGVGTVLWPFV